MNINKNHNINVCASYHVAYARLFKYKTNKTYG